MTEQIHYTMVIEWSDENHAFLVTLPEWADRVMMPVTHGDTYDDAAKNGQEVLKMLVDGARAEGESLPAPRLFADRPEQSVPAAMS